MNRRSKSSIRPQAWLAPIAAAVVFGGWAALVNVPHGAGFAIRAALGQGIYALFSTRLVTWAALAVWARNADASLRFAKAFLAGFVVMLSIPLLVHSLLGTPEILAAMLPGAVWGSGYIAIYLLLQTHRERAAASPRTRRGQAYDRNFCSCDRN